MSEKSARKALDEEGRIISLYEAAEILGTSYPTAMRLAKSGELKAFRIRKTSHTRIRMNQAVYRDTPQRAAVSLSVSRSAMHSANAIQVAGGSFESASRPPVLRENVLPQPRHSHLCDPSASRPFFTNLGQPHLGQASGSPGHLDCFR